MSKEFLNSPEAQEYINKLQTGRQELAPAASDLEREAVANLRELTQRLRQITVGKSDAEKQIEQLKAQVAGMGRDADVVTGEMTAYARLLASAESSRRKPKDDKPADGGQEAKPADDKPAEAKKKPGPPKGQVPPHLAKKSQEAKAKTSEGNGAEGMAEAAPDAVAPSTEVN